MAALDHVVINALGAVDAAEALFAGLGFTLTPRGHHDLGSLNHLMVVPGAYLEIVGVPAQGRQRQEVLDSPLGLSGIVLRTEDADATFASLVAAGFDPLPPMAFSRPVRIGAQEHRAAFRTVRMKPDFFPGGRVYFCQHLTPDLVWRPEWQDHPNGFAAIAAIEVESPDPAATADRFAAAFEARRAAGAEPCRVVLDDGCEIRVHAGPAARMRATGLVLRDVATLEAGARAARGATPSRDGDGRVTVDLADLDTTLVCDGPKGPPA